MNKKILLTMGILLITFSLSAPTANSLPAPREAQGYVFSEVTPTNESSNHVVIYRKDGQFSDGSTAYNPTHFLNKKAQPLLSFSYNPQMWKLTEDDKENQILISHTNNNLKIWLAGNGAPVYFLNGNVYLSLPNYAATSTENSTIYYDNDRAKLGNWIYVFMDSKNYQQLRSYPNTSTAIYASGIPFQFYLYNNQDLTTVEKQSFKDILATVRYNKESLRDMLSEHEHYYNRSPLLFSTEEEFLNWKVKDDYDFPGYKVTYPPFLKIRELNEINYKGNTTTVVSTIDPAIDFWKTDQDGLSTFTEQNSDTWNIEATTFHQSIYPSSHPYLQHLILPLTDWVENTCQHQASAQKFSDLFETNVKVFSKYRIFFGANAEDQTLNIEDFNSQKYDGAHLNKNPRFLLAYPYARLYALKTTTVFDLSKFSLCLSAVGKNYWLHLGDTDGYVILAEFIPDDNVKVNDLLKNEFTNLIRNLTFSNDGTKPSGKFDVNAVTEYNSKKQFAYSPIEPKIDIYVDPWRSPIDYDKDGKKQINKLSTYIESLPDIIKEKNDNTFYIGQNVGCEKNDTICVDYGEPWDYMNSDEYGNKNNLFHTIIFKVSSYAKKLIYFLKMTVTSMLKLVA